MVCDLLLHNGIVSAKVEGEYLQGGVGLLQAIDVVRVVVVAEEQRQAMQIIADWEAAQNDDSAAADKTAEGAAVQSPRSAKTSLTAGLPMLLLGLLLGIGVMFLLYKTPITREGIDYNGDGELDVSLLYLGMDLDRAEYDRNLDGHIDMIDNFNARGLAKSSRIDADFDGVFETGVRYRYDLVSRIESDTDNNGSIDLISDYEHGELHRMTILNASGSAAVKHMYYRLGKLVCAELDSNGDGVFETRIDYDFLEQPVGQSTDGQKCLA